MGWDKVVKGNEGVEGVVSLFVPVCVPGARALSGQPRALEKIPGAAPRELLPVGKEQVPRKPCPSSQDKQSMRQVMQAVDKANGYSFGDQEHRSLEALMSAAVGADFHFSSYPLWC